MASADIQHILDDKPFADTIVIKDIQKLQEEHAHSGNAYWVIAADGKRYKLRACNNVDLAMRIERTIARVQHIFPKLYGRDRQYLLMEALEGYRRLTEEDLLKNLHAIGRIYGEVHQLQDAGNHDHRTFYHARLFYLKTEGLIDDELYQKLREKFEHTIANIEYRISMDYNDLHAGNMMQGPKGDILFVDEEGLAYRVKGLGLAKLLKTLKHDDQYKEFMKGYTEVTDGAYLTPEYLEHIRLVEIVQALANKRLKKTYPEAILREVEMLKKLVA